MFKKQALVFLGPIFLLLVIGSIGFAENSWQIRINIPEFKLYLYHGSELYNTYFVAVGKPSSPSPTGDFIITTKVYNPTWYPTDGRPPVPPGPNNPLGKYWMGLNNLGYGIHGNSADWSIGNPISKGCFRMHNADVSKVYSLIHLGTPVKLTYETVTARLDNEKRAWLEIFPDVYNRVKPKEEIIKKLSVLNWDYLPHLKAMEALGLGKMPSFEVPRMIRIEGDGGGYDGFYWSQEVYLTKNFVNAVGASIEAGAENDFGGEYVKLRAIWKSGAFKYDWDLDRNSLKLLRFKVIVNGNKEAISGLIGPDKMPRIDLVQLAGQQGASIAWDQVAAEAICDDIPVTGEVRAGALWVEPGVLTQIWPNLEWIWDEKSWTLELEF